MFITKEEAESRLKSKSNPFGSHKRDSEDWGRAPLVVPSSPSEPAEDAPVAETVEETSEPQPTLSDYQADKILAQASTVRADSYLGKSLARVPEGPRRDVQAAIGASTVLLGPTVAGQLYSKSVPQTAAYGAAVTKHDNHYGANKTAPVPELERRLSAFKETLAYAAGEKLEATLAALSPQKLSEVKRATNLSKIARDMATVMDKVSISGKGEQQAIHFHVYRPEMRSVNHYESVSVGVGLGSGLNQRVSGVVKSTEVMPMPGEGDASAAGYDAEAVREAISLIPSYPGSGDEFQNEASGIVRKQERERQQ